MKPVPVTTDETPRNRWAYGRLERLRRCKLPVAGLGASGVAVELADATICRHAHKIAMQEASARADETARNL
jgi:hypothetical protein